MFNRHHHFKRDKEGPFQKGDLKYVVLDLLNEKPSYGYEVIRALEERSHGFYSPSPGVVYPTLQMIEEMGYALATDRDGKKVYEITEAGKKFLSDRSDFTSEVKKHMHHHWNPDDAGVVAETMRETHRVARLIGHELRHAGPEKARRVRDIVSRACREIEAVLEGRE